MFAREKYHQKDISKKVKNKVNCSVLTKYLEIKFKSTFEFLEKQWKKMREKDEREKTFVGIAHKIREQQMVLFGVSTEIQKDVLQFT